MIKILREIIKVKGFFSTIVGMLILISCSQTTTGAKLNYGNSESHNNVTKEELKKIEDDESPTYY
jgi:hypothetical protein